MDNSDIMSVSYQPGFSLDMTYWEAVIDRNGWLRQKVVVGNPDSEYYNRVLRFWAKLSGPQVAQLWEIVERIGFREFKRGYTHETFHVTDRPWYQITVRFQDRLKEVKAYDLPTLADFEHQSDMIGFQELWEAILAHAPFGQVPIAKGLPRPWWQFW